MYYAFHIMFEFYSHNSVKQDGVKTLLFINSLPLTGCCQSHSLCCNVAFIFTLPSTIIFMGIVF